MARTVSVRQFRAELSSLLDGVARSGEHVVVTRNGRPEATLIGIDEYEALEETAEILSDPDTMAAIEESLADFARGDFITLAEFEAEMDARQPDDQ
ncbi:MAG: type II toxin-antitoxin system Phd/YefM family antitoxin [Actinobacteria bacterium]|jgi:prevent-host-death family protein|nr:type II toxin-antitoxin system Phd/YefM family antitoxin [Actinomycetota bacterium]MDP7549766.1 type II toxin-antitoxin system Phd/YefM family antitoxin [Acidimicrobiales bacterium]MBT3687460.1 type II toxin-antitoxin system Phd/YefM family antitoxin [Actinomycetota bacterium]MBT4038244.1 type II toxin-antitoxin system Phd/YefM family antitoxin [Actinomycetota bacterium]MBT4279135.1 type II toxin-antitoxin system Phd/YefM family antitoxin [Actinomycetota bacterium]|tara:strand:+ start:2748 stop:3035 length:288 start_codon:yes stop_codon:yes gene_type:complete